MMLSGCGSIARTNTYRFDASYAILASVGKRAALPSVGRHSWKALIVGAALHTTSASFPSITGADSARIAVALVSVGAGTAVVLAGFASMLWEGACAITCRLSASP